MTIAAGFVCSDGLVLFADTEEQEGYTKTNAEKIREYPSDNCKLLIANSGNGNLADSLIDRIFDAVADGGTNEKAIIAAIRKTILDFHSSEVSLYPADNDHKQVGLIMGLQVGDKPLLMHADATALKKVREFAVIGYGAEIKFLAQQLYHRGMPVKHGTLIANYLVETAKKHVQGCGGESRIAVLTGKKIEILHFFNIYQDARLFSDLFSNYRAVLLSIPDEQITDEQFDNCVGWFVEEAWKSRKDHLRGRAFNTEIMGKLRTAEAVACDNVQHYYEPPPQELDLLDRRREMEKYKPRLRSLKQRAPDTKD